MAEHRGLLPQPDLTREARQRQMKSAAVNYEDVSIEERRTNTNKGTSAYSHARTHPHTHPRMHPPMHPPTHPPMHPTTHPPTNAPTNAPTHQPTNPPTHSLARSLTHSESHSLTHSHHMRTRARMVCTHARTHIPTTHAHVIVENKWIEKKPRMSTSLDQVFNFRYRWVTFSGLLLHSV